MKMILSQRWQEVRLKMRTRGNRGLSTRLFIIIMVLLMVFFFLIDFDLSIFTNNI